MGVVIKRFLQHFNPVTQVSYALWRPWHFLHTSLKNWSAGNITRRELQCATHLPKTMSRYAEPQST